MVEFPPWNPVIQTQLYQVLPIVTFSFHICSNLQKPNSYTKFYFVEQSFDLHTVECDSLSKPFYFSSSSRLLSGSGVVSPLTSRGTSSGGGFSFPENVGFFVRTIAQFLWKKKNPISLNQNKSCTKS